MNKTWTFITGIIIGLIAATVIYFALKPSIVGNCRKVDEEMMDKIEEED